MSDSKYCCDDRCRKEKEKVWKYRGKNREGQDEEVSSIWCKSHACRALKPRLATKTSDDTKDPQWVLCSFAAKRGRRYCETHLQCFSDTCGWQRINMDRPQDRPLCINHKCTEPGCPYEASSSSQKCQDHRDICRLPRPGCHNQVIQINGEDGHYCPEHTCKERGCFHQTFERWCPDHKPCGATNCSQERLIVRVVDPIRLKRELYCRDHMPVPCRACQTDNIFNRAPVGEALCITHRCREQGCHAQRIQKGSNDIFPKEYKEYCADHNCRSDECPLPIFQLTTGEIFASEYCQAHECECMEPPCRKRREPEKPYCDDHFCDYADCCEIRSQDKKINVQKRCSDHDKVKIELERKLKESEKKIKDEENRKKKKEEDQKKEEEDKKKREEKEQEQNEKANSLMKIKELEENILILQAELKKEKEERNKEQKERTNELDQKKKAQEDDEKAKNLEMIKELKENIEKLEAESRKEKEERRKDQEERAREESQKMKEQEEAERRSKEQLEEQVEFFKKLLNQKDDEGRSKSRGDDRVELERLREQVVNLMVKFQELEVKSSFDNSMNFRYMGAGIGSVRPSESGYGSEIPNKNRKN